MARRSRREPCVSRCVPHALHDACAAWQQCARAATHTPYHVLAALLWQKWLVLDGDLDGDWMQQMITAVDGSHVVTLPSKERIHLSPESGVRVVLEAPSLQYAPPSLLSAAGILCLNPADDTRGWQAVAARYARRGRPCVCVHTAVCCQPAHSHAHTQHGCTRRTHTAG